MAGLKEFAARRSVQVGAAFVVGTGLGATASYHITRGKLKEHYEERASAEIAEAREHYRLVKEVFDAPEDIPTVEETELEKKYQAPNEELKTVVEKLDYTAAADNQRPVPGPQTTVDVNQTADGVEVTTKVHNAFANQPESRSDEDWNWDEETALRLEIPERPYVLTSEEYFHNEHDWDQSSLTYYEKDDILTDERDEIIPDEDSVVGNHNLMRFGVMSKDPNIVYVRNERLEHEYEIALSKGSYAQEVHGFIQHEDKPGPRRFRTNDG